MAYPDTDLARRIQTSSPMMRTVIVGLPFAILLAATAAATESTPDTTAAPPVSSAPPTTIAPPTTPGEAAPLPASAPAAPTPPVASSAASAPALTEDWYGQPENERRSSTPAQKRSKNAPRTHDGFYTRASIGGGYLSTGIESEEGAARVRGTAVAMDLLIGGTPVRGLALGGGFALDVASSPTVATSQGKAEGADATLSAGTFGVFADWFPDATGGFHAGLLAGYTTSSFTAHAVGMTAAASGWGGGLLAGYDGWVADDWSLGLLLRAVGSSLSSSVGGVEESVVPASFSVELTSLYH